MALAVALDPRVEIPPCVAREHGVDLERVRYLVDIELAERTDTRGSITVSCTEDGVSLELAEPGGEILDQQRIDLRGIEPSVGARLIALGVAELATPELIEEAEEPEDEPEEELRAPEQPPPPSRTRQPRWHLDAGASGRGFPTGRAGTFGLELGVRHRALPFLGWRLSVSTHAGFARAGGIGRIVVFDVTAAGFLLLQRRYGRADLYGGLGARGGWARMAGRADDQTTALASTLDGGWFGPAGTFGVDVLIPRSRVFVGVAGEAGWAPVGVEARVDGTRNPSVAGPWVGGRLSVGARL